MRELLECDLKATPPADRRKQRTVDPVDYRTIVLARSTKTSLVLMHVGDKQVVALQHAERVQQRQRFDETGGSAVADVHAHVAVSLNDGAQRLAVDAGRDLIRVQLFDGHIPL